MSDIKERLALECPRRSVDVADHSLCQPDSLCVACAALDRLAALERELAEARSLRAVADSNAAAARAEVVDAVKDGYILAARLIQSDLMLDDVDRASIDARLAAWYRYQQEREGERAHP